MAASKRGVNGPNESFYGDPKKDLVLSLQNEILRRPFKLLNVNENSAN